MFVYPDVPFCSVKVNVSSNEDEVVEKKAEEIWLELMLPSIPIITLPPDESRTEISADIELSISSIVVFRLAGRTTSVDTSLPSMLDCRA